MSLIRTSGSQSPYEVKAYDRTTTLATTFPSDGAGASNSEQEPRTMREAIPISIRIKSQPYRSEIDADFSLDLQGDQLA